MPSSSLRAPASCPRASRRPAGPISIVDGFWRPARARRSLQLVVTVDASLQAGYYYRPVWFVRRERRANDGDGGRAEPSAPLRRDHPRRRGTRDNYKGTTYSAASERGPGPFNCGAASDCNGQKSAKLSRKSGSMERRKRYRTTSCFTRRPAASVFSGGGRRRRKRQTDKRDRVHARPAATRERSYVNLGGIIFRSAAASPRVPSDESLWSSSLASKLQRNFTPRFKNVAY